MSHYFDYRVNVPPGAGANTAAWSNVEPLLAVAHTNGSIEFYLEEVRGRSCWQYSQCL